jgi:amino acid transporter
MSTVDAPAPAPKTPRTPGDEVEAFGYHQAFQRTIKSFSSFAIGFSFISITSGIFTTFAFLLATSGPRGIWMWIVASIGQLLVTLVYAQLAGRIPLAGQSYQWASRLSNPKTGWAFGWLSYAFLAIVVVAVNYGFISQAFMPLFDIAPSTATTQWLVVAAGVVEAGVIILSTRLTSSINSAAVVTEVVGIVGLTIVLLIAAAVSGKGSLSNLTSSGVIDSHSGYYAYNGPFMLALLLGAYTIVGFEAAANLAEETDEPRKVVPKAMIRATWASGLIGMFFLVALTVAMPDVKTISTSATPVTAIMAAQLGSVVERIFLIFAVVSLFANALIVMLSGSRMVYAMSRDRRFPGFQLFARVNKRTATPVWAPLLILAGLIVIVFAVGGNADALTTLFTAATILPAIIYLSTVILFLAVRHRLHDVPGVFSLGSWQVPVAVASIAWLLVELTALLLPSMFWDAVKVVGLFVVAGIVIFAGFLVFSRSSLEHEPGTDVLETSTL